MKKIFLLSMSSLAMLMADFTLDGSKLALVSDTTSTVTDPTTTAPANTSGTSKYLEPITLPACDANNPEVQFIKSNADWSTINSSNKRIFCVSPGNYTSLGNINLTSSGTAEKRRYIILNNGNDTHPGKLEKSELANFLLIFRGASYWTIDRWSSFDHSIKRSIQINGGSEYNIINRAFTDNINNAIMLNDGANNNTIQNSRFQNQNAAGLANDSDCILTLGWNKYYYEVKNLKIINNEFKNHNHHVQFVRHNNPDGNIQDMNVEGAIIDHNDFYNDKDIYTDCNGKSDPNGLCQRAEMQVVLKGGSYNQNNPIIVTNNHFWGNRDCDRLNPDGTTSDRSAHGETFEAYYEVKHLILEDNVFFDAEIAIKLADRYIFAWGTDDVSVKRNLLYDVGSLRGKSTHVPLWVNQGNNINISENAFVNTRMDYAVFRNNGSVFFGGNDIVNAEGGLDSANNGTPLQGYKTNNINNAGYTKDYTFTTDKFTKTPRLITLKNAI